MSIVLALNKPLSLWLASLIFVIVIFLLNAKNKFLSFNLKINIYELETLEKWFCFQQLFYLYFQKDSNIPYLGISLYKIWLTVVVISTISYVSYLIQNIYSHQRDAFDRNFRWSLLFNSNDGSFIKKSESTQDSNIFTASIVGATLMMYLRLAVIVAILIWKFSNSFIPIFSLFYSLFDYSFHIL